MGGRVRSAGACVLLALACATPVAMWAGAAGAAAPVTVYSTCAGVDHPPFARQYQGNGRSYAILGQATDQPAGTPFAATLTGAGQTVDATGNTGSDGKVLEFLPLFQFGTYQFTVAAPDGATVQKGTLTVGPAEVPCDLTTLTGGPLVGSTTTEATTTTATTTTEATTTTQPVTSATDNVAPTTVPSTPPAKAVDHRAIAPLVGGILGLIGLGGLLIARWPPPPLRRKCACLTLKAKLAALRRYIAETQAAIDKWDAEGTETYEKAIASWQEYIGDIMRNGDYCQWLAGALPGMLAGWTDMLHSMKGVVLAGKHGSLSPVPKDGWAPAGGGAWAENDAVAAVAAAGARAYAGVAAHATSTLAAGPGAAAPNGTTAAGGAADAGAYVARALELCDQATRWAMEYPPEQVNASLREAELLKRSWTTELGELRSQLRPDLEYDAAGAQLAPRIAALTEAIASADARIAQITAIGEEAARVAREAPAMRSQIETALGAMRAAPARAPAAVGTGDGAGAAVSASAPGAPVSAHSGGDGGWVRVGTSMWAENASIAAGVQVASAAYELMKTMPPDFNPAGVRPVANYAEAIKYAEAAIAQCKAAQAWLDSLGPDYWSKLYRDAESDLASLESDYARFRDEVRFQRNLLATEKVQERVLARELAECLSHDWPDCADCGPAVFFPALPGAPDPKRPRNDLPSPPEAPPAPPAPQGGGAPREPKDGKPGPSGDPAGWTDEQREAAAAQSDARRIRRDLQVLLRAAEAKLAGLDATSDDAKALRARIEELKAALAQIEAMQLDDFGELGRLYDEIADIEQSIEWWKQFVVDHLNGFSPRVSLAPDGKTVRVDFDPLPAEIVKETNDQLAQLRKLRDERIARVKKLFERRPGSAGASGAGTDTAGGPGAPPTAPGAPAGALPADAAARLARQAQQLDARIVEGIAAVHRAIATGHYDVSGHLQALHADVVARDQLENRIVKLRLDLEDAAREKAVLDEAGHHLDGLAALDGELRAGSGRVLDALSRNDPAALASALGDLRAAAGRRAELADRYTALTGAPAPPAGTIDTPASRIDERRIVEGLRALPRDAGYRASAIGRRIEQLDHDIASTAALLTPAALGDPAAMASIVDDLRRLLVTRERYDTAYEGETGHRYDPLWHLKQADAARARAEATLDLEVRRWASDVFGIGSRHPLVAVLLALGRVIGADALMDELRTFDVPPDPVSIYAELLARLAKRAKTPQEAIRIRAGILQFVDRLLNDPAATEMWRAPDRATLTALLRRTVSDIVDAALASGDPGAMAHALVLLARPAEMGGNPADPRVDELKKRLAPVVEAALAAHEKADRDALASGKVPSYELRQRAAAALKEGRFKTFVDLSLAALAHEPVVDAATAGARLLQQLQALASRADGPVRDQLVALLADTQKQLWARLHGGLDSARDTAVARAQDAARRLDELEGMNPGQARTEQMEKAGTERSDALAEVSVYERLRIALLVGGTIDPSKRAAILERAIDDVQQEAGRVFQRVSERDSQKLGFKDWGAVSVELDAVGARELELRMALLALDPSKKAAVLKEVWTALNGGVGPKPDGMSEDAWNEKVANEIRVLHHGGLLRDYDSALAAYDNDKTPANQLRLRQLRSRVEFFDHLRWRAVSLDPSWQALDEWVEIRQREIALWKDLASPLGHLGIHLDHDRIASMRDGFRAEIGAHAIEIARRLHDPRSADPHAMGDAIGLMRYVRKLRKEDIARGKAAWEEYFDTPFYKRGWFTQTSRILNVERVLESIFDEEMFVHALGAATRDGMTPAKLLDEHYQVLAEKGFISGGRFVVPKGWVYDPGTAGEVSSRRSWDDELFNVESALKTVATVILPGAMAGRAVMFLEAAEDATMLASLGWSAARITAEAALFTSFSGAVASGNPLAMIPGLGIGAREWGKQFVDNLVVMGGMFAFNLLVAEPLKAALVSADTVKAANTELWKLTGAQVVSVFGSLGVDLANLGLEAASVMAMNRLVERVTGSPGRHDEGLLAELVQTSAFLAELKVAGAAVEMTPGLRDLARAPTPAAREPERAPRQEPAPQPAPAAPAASVDVNAVRGTKAPAGAVVDPGLFGMRPLVAKVTQLIADAHNIRIQIRPTNREALHWRDQGHPPKPMAIKAKTINDVDLLIGPEAWRAPGAPNVKGLVGYFEPRLPANLADLPPELYKKVRDRYLQRREEWADQADKMDHLAHDGLIEIRGGVVIDTGVCGPGVAGKGTGLGITGDHDIWRFAHADGRPMTLAESNELLEILKGDPLFAAMHGAHTDWIPLTAVDRGIDAVIRDSHEPGKEALIEFAPGEKDPHAVYETPPAVVAREAALKAVTDRFATTRPELADLLVRLIRDEAHRLNMVEALKDPATRDRTLDLLEEMAGSRRLTGTDLAAWRADNPGRGPLYEPVPADANLTADGRSRKDALLAEAKGLDPARAVGAEATGAERELVADYAGRLLRRVEPAVRREIRALVEALGAEGVVAGWSARAKNGEGLLDKVRRMVEGRPGAPGRADAQVGDIVDGVGARITVESTADLARVLARVVAHFGTGDGGRIVEIENMYAKPKRKAPAYRVITLTIRIDRGGLPYTFELQLTTRRASIAADLEHNTLYKPYLADITEAAKQLVREAMAEAAALDEGESRARPAPADGGAGAPDARPSPRGDPAGGQTGPPDGGPQDRGGRP